MFKSESQKKYLFSKKPEIAKEFAEKTPKSAYKKLPENSGDKKKVPGSEYVRDRDGLMKISKQNRRKS